MARQRYSANQRHIAKPDCPSYVRTPVTVSRQYADRPIHITTMLLTNTGNAYDVQSVYLSVSEAKQLCDMLSVAIAQVDTLPTGYWT